MPVDPNHNTTRLESEHKPETTEENSLPMVKNKKVPLMLTNYTIPPRYDPAGGGGEATLAFC
jgi:hypothetical protein